MDDKDYELINKVLNNMSSGTTEIVNSYATWHFTSAIGWMVFAAIVIGLGIYGLIKNHSIEWRITFCAIIFLGGMIFFGNLPNVFAPEGRAIHGLIKDIRG